MGSFSNSDHTGEALNAVGRRTEHEYRVCTFWTEVCLIYVEGPLGSDQWMLDALDAGSCGASNL